MERVVSPKGYMSPSFADKPTKVNEKPDTSGMNPGKEFMSSINNGGSEAKQRIVLIEWLNSIHPGLSLSVNASDEELRGILVDSSVLTQIANRLKSGCVNEGSDLQTDRVKRFLAVLDEMGLPRFEAADLEKGSMTFVVECLLTVRAQLISNAAEEERKKILSESKFQRALRSPVMSETSAALVHHVGLKFHEVFQLKQGRYADLPPAKISEMMKSSSLDNAPTQSLLSVVNGILEESIERKNDEIPHRVVFLLRKVVQEIERRISTQAEHLRTQYNNFKTREERYQSRIKVLEALATGTCNETEVAMDQLQQTKNSGKMEEKRRNEEEDMAKLLKEKDSSSKEASTLKQELEVTKRMYEKEKDRRDQEVSALRQELEVVKKGYGQEKDNHDQEISELRQEIEAAKRMYEGEKDNRNREVSALKQEIEVAKRTYEQRCVQSETETKGTKLALQEKLKELESQLEVSERKVRELEINSKRKVQNWNKKQQSHRSFVDFQGGELRELRLSTTSIKQEFLKAQNKYGEDFRQLGLKLKEMAYAAENYHAVLAENRKLFNEVQDLKGNIRVYCRIRPFLPGQAGKQTIVERIGEDGELVVSNPSKQGKDANRLFKFNKVFGPAASQVDVYSDIQPFVRSVLDGYNVCIFAYGQTGSGKTYTMTGPNAESEESWGVNYRALNDLFSISETRRSSISYEITVHMIEIYNEQVRDLLSNDGAQKKLGISNVSQPNGLAVPDASIEVVKSTSDVLDLMDIGMRNRAVGSTALNDRSSRSHSILTIHVRGTDLKNGTVFRGSLHLIDLAGSERVDRSEVTGDRLKEAQHINKSLSALGDVISALAQKSTHIPYRNSKLTQVLQTSLGGQAKTLMLVQLNPDTTSYSESLSTLKFAERVSGVELGAAKSSKEGRDVRELMEQVASLKNTIAKQDEEIERLQLLKDLKNVYPAVNEKRGTTSSKYGSPTAIKSPNSGRGSGLGDRTPSDSDLSSMAGEKLVETNSMSSLDEFKRSYESLGDVEISEVGDQDFEDDSTHTMSSETDGFAESSITSGVTESPSSVERLKSPSKISRSSARQGQISSPTGASPSKLSSTKKTTPAASTFNKPPRRWQ